MIIIFLSFSLVFPPPPSTPLCFSFWIEFSILLALLSCCTIDCIVQCSMLYRIFDTIIQHSQVFYVHLSLDTARLWRMLILWLNHTRTATCTKNTKECCSMKLSVSVSSASTTDHTIIWYNCYHHATNWSYYCYSHSTNFSAAIENVYETFCPQSINTVFELTCQLKWLEKRCCYNWNHNLLKEAGSE